MSDELKQNGFCNKGTALQLGEKDARMAIFEGFVSGHEFTRAANATKHMRALAPEGHISGEFVPQKDFFTKLFSRANKVQKDGGVVQAAEKVQTKSEFGKELISRG